MQPIQLKLWADDAGRVEVQCQRCGYVQDVLPVLRQRHEDRERAILEHPRVRSLRDRTAAFLASTLPVLMSGQPVGVTQLAEEAEYSASGAYHQVRLLVAAGVLASVKKSAGGTYHLYHLSNLNGFSSS
jgi:hypothetical protein